jgi:hypothetical protein
MLGEGKVATNLAASFGLGEVGAITVIEQDHVTGQRDINDGIRMRCCIVQEVDDGVERGLRGFCLGGGIEPIATNIVGSTAIP